MKDVAIMSGYRETDCLKSNTLVEQKRSAKILLGYSESDDHTTTMMISVDIRGHKFVENIFTPNIL